MLNREAGADKLSPELLSAATCSAVNLAEVHSKLIARGFSAADAWKATLYPIGERADFTLDHAQVAGNLIAETRRFGLSLGDRACLALALELDAPVYTADKAWKNLKLRVPIHVIR